MSSIPPVWLITGSSSGIGIALALRVLQAKHHVIATVRSKAKSAAAVSELEAAGAKVTELDLAAGDTTIAAAAQEALRIYGRVDVVVNNAGYAVIGPVEDIDDAASRAQLETNYFGPMSLIRALLPSLRAQKSGVIVNVSSTAGFDGLPSSGVYSASKFALEGASEGLAREIGPLGINTLIIEPGGFRTNFGGALAWAGDGISEPYKGGPVEGAVARLREYAEKRTQKGDPIKGAEVIFDSVEKVRGEKRVDVKRVLMGSDAIQRMEYKLGQLQRDLKDGLELAKSTDF